MESSEAAFVNMVMDRLHAVEAQNTSLLEVNKKLRCDLQERSKPLYLKPDLATFNDGCKLNVSGTAYLQAPYIHSGFLPELPIDKMHGEAIAFVGEMTFAAFEGEPVLRLGKKDKHTSVNEFVEAVWNFWQGVFEGCFVGWQFHMGVYYMDLEYRV